MYQSRIHTHDSRIGITHVQCIVPTYQYIAVKCGGGGAKTAAKCEYMQQVYVALHITHACMHAGMHTCVYTTTLYRWIYSTYIQRLKSRHEVDTWRNKLQEKRIGESNLHTKICIKLVIRGV